MSIIRYKDYNSTIYDLGDDIFIELKYSGINLKSSVVELIEGTMINTANVVNNIIKRGNSNVVDDSLNISEHGTFVLENKHITFLRNQNNVLCSENDDLTMQLELAQQPSDSQIEEFMDLTVTLDEFMDENKSLKDELIATKAQFADTINELVTENRSLKAQLVDTKVETADTEAELVDTEVEPVDTEAEPVDTEQKEPEMTNEALSKGSFANVVNTIIVKDCGGCNQSTDKFIRCRECSMYLHKDGNCCNIHNNKMRHRCARVCTHQNQTIIKCKICNDCICAKCLPTHNVSNHGDEYMMCPGCDIRTIPRKSNDCGVGYDKCYECRKCKNGYVIV